MTNKAPFGRMGGKSKIAKQLIRLFPKTFKIYVEPFVGAGNVIFRKPMVEGQVEIINDLDEKIFKILKGLKNRNAYIQNNIPRRITKTIFQALKNKKDVVSILATIKSSYFSQGRTFNGGDDTVVFIKTDFTPFKDRLKDVIILNENFADVIKKADSIDTFFFLDPPYESEDQRDYTNYVHPEAVLKALTKIKGKFMITYNNSPNIREIFKSYRIRTIETTYQPTTTIEKRNVVELVITNY